MTCLKMDWMRAGAAAVCVMAAGLALPALAQPTGLGALKDAAKKAAAHEEQAAQDKVNKLAEDKLGAKAQPAGEKLDLSQPLPTDERLVTGTLPNGLSYIVMKHANPPGRAAMWIHVSSGSLNEKDNQRGIAHYLEHMAFNGSENFPPGSVVDFFQSMGLRFGQDQNAFTSFDQTTFQLSFPDVKPETLAKGMQFFSDVSGKLLLKPEEIDKERQVILEEKRTRAGGRQRIQDYVLERLAPGSLVGQRLPIGIDATLMKMSRPDFVDYYDHWYVPSNMTVIVVADADPKVVIDQITKSFGAGEKKPKPVDQDPKVSPTQGVRAVVASDKELTQASIEMMRLWPKQTPTTTVGDMRRDIVQQMGTMAFNRRIGAKLDKGGTAYLSARASGSQLFNTAFATSVNCDGEAAKWKDMIAEAGADLQRARLHGFTQRELDDIKTEMVSQAERQVTQESTMPAGRIIQGINGALAQEDTITSAKQELELLNKLLPTITKEEVGKVFADQFDMTNVVFVAEFPSEMAGGVPSESDVIVEGTKALQAKPAAEAEESRPTALLSKLPTPGKVVDESEHAATKVLSGWLDNGVRFHYRFMDYHKDQASITISLAGGSIQETPENRGIAELAGVAWSHPATSTLTHTNIRDIMNGKKARAGGGVGLDTMNVNVSGSPADMEAAMQQAYLMLTDPVIEKSAYDQWKIRQLRSAEERKKVVDGIFLETMSSTIYPATEVRTQPLTVEQIRKQTPEASQKWLRDAIAAAPIEVSIVGDISKDEAMKLLTTYVGSLPKREQIAATTLDSLRKIERPKGPRTVEKTVDTETDKADVAVGFYACDMNNVQDRRNLLIASRIVSTRMLKLIREEEQLAYSPRAGLRPGVEFPGFGTFSLVTQTNPTKIPRLLELTWKLYDDFAKDGPTDEEMATVKKQMANELDEQMREPQFWQAQTALMTYRANDLDNVVSAPEYYQKLTGAEVKQAFDKYYVPEGKMAVAVKPARVKEAPEKPAAPSSEGAPAKENPAAKPKPSN
jgi:zinc protease